MLAPATALLMSHNRTFGKNIGMPSKQHYIKNSGGYNYLRFRRQPLVPLPDGPIAAVIKTSEYKAALAAAKSAEKPRPIQQKKSPGGGPTVRETVAGHLGSRHYREDLKPGSQAMRRMFLINWAEGRAASTDKPALIGCGDGPILDLTQDDIAAQLSAWREQGPWAACKWLSAVRAMIRERKEERALPKDFDPTMGLSGTPRKQKGRQKEDGFKTWTREMVQQYRAHYPSGTPERIAFEMIYWTGAACVDVVKLTRAHIINGVFQFNRQKSGIFACPKATPELLAEIAASKVIDLTGGPVIRGRQGRPFVGSNGNRVFSTEFRKWAREAGIPVGYGAHGIRKRAATNDAEAGRPTTWLKAKYGWKLSAEADLYTDAADRVRVILGEDVSTKVENPR